MTDIKLKKQITELRNSLFDKEKEEGQKNLKPANINSKSQNRSSGIFDDVRSMDKRLERLEETFYNYAYDSTKILTSFHRNTKVLEQLINNITKKNELSAKTINKIEKLIPHTCPLVPKEGSKVVNQKKDILKTILFYFGAVCLITLAVFLSNIIYEIIYFKLNIK